MIFFTDPGEMVVRDLGHFYNFDSTMYVGGMFLLVLDNYWSILYIMEDINEDDYVPSLSFVPRTDYHVKV